MAKTTKKYDKKFYEQVCTEIDRIFDLYGKPTDNCIVLGAYYDTEDRDNSTWQKGHSFICEDSVALVAAGDFRYFSPYYDWDYEYNPYVRPVMHDISAFTHVSSNDYDWDEHDEDDESDTYKIRRGLTVSPVSKNSVMPKDVDKIPYGVQVEKLRDYFVDAQKLVTMIKPFMHHVCGSASSYCDDSTNCFWRNYIVIGRDYKFRTFTMRYDAMMQSKSTKFDDMVVDDTLAKCGHVKQDFKPTKDYGPTEDARVREPVPYIEWKEWEKYVKSIDCRNHYEIGVESLDVVPFSKMKLKELPISMITDIFIQFYDRGSDPKLLNMFYYESENKDEDIYALCQNSVYEYDYFGRRQIGFNWNTLCCLHSDTNSRKEKSTKVVETYIGDMTPDEFIKFIRETFWSKDMEYTGSRDLLHYGLVKKLTHPSYKNFGNYENGTQYCWSHIHKKPWYLTIKQYEAAKEKLKKNNW